MRSSWSTDRAFIIALLILLSFFHFSPQNSFAVQNTYYRNAIQLINAKDYRGAYRETRNLLKETPDDIFLLRIQGVCLMETGYHDAAVSVLQKAVTIDPESVACRYYLGQALAYRGSIREAVTLLESVLTLAPDSAYAKHAQNILPELQELIDSETIVSDENRWNIYLRTAVEHDDNVPLRSLNSDLEGPTDSLRLNYSLYGEIRFPDQKIDEMPITLGLGYSLSGAEYDRSIFDYYDLFSQDLSAYLSRNGAIFDNFYNLRLEVHASDTQLGGDPYSKVSGIKLSLQYNWLEMIATTFSSSWDNKDYEVDTDFPEYYSLDGNEYNLGFFNSFYFLENSLVLGLNYNYRVMNAEGFQAELRSNDITASLTTNLPFELRLYGQVVYQQEDYPEYYPVDRFDDVWTFYASLQRPLLDDVLFLELAYTYATANSDYDFARYERNVVSAALSLSY
ncbi:MAG: tetratricopeptide repeat protein [Desulfobulbaceae bacterium]|nr:tetratricopeptide repeat protein [Desulfobulbaceae bacterium]